MAPIFGPGRTQIIDLLRSSDWRSHLPLTLATGTPCAVIRVDEAGTLRLRTLAVDRAAADAARRRREAAGDHTWMPESELEFMVEARVVVEASTPAQFIAKIQAIHPWPFGAEDSEAVERELQREREQAQLEAQQRAEQRRASQRQEHERNLRQQRSARARDELYALISAEPDATQLAQVPARLVTLDDGDRRALLHALAPQLRRIFVKGVHLFQRQQYDEAYPHLDLACRHWKEAPADDGWTLQAMTFLWNERGDFDASVAWIRRFMATGTEIPPAMVTNCVNAFVGAACYDDAIAVGLLGARRGAPPSVHHAVACAFALAGRADEALDQIEQARARGYPQYASMAFDPQLASLHEHPRFRRAFAP